MTSQTILVIEDDEPIALGLRINLEAEGYRVVVASDGQVGLEKARTEHPDLVVLDVMLPNMNGLEILQSLRREGYGMPIIMLSARDSEMDKVTGLELGAEDYVAKPFGLAELLARIRAALRRGVNTSKQSLVRFGDIQMDLKGRIVYKQGTPIEMTSTEFDILKCLAHAKGEALSRKAIFQKVWGGSHYGTLRTVDNFIQQLRAKLEEEPQSPRHIHTVRGVGYRLDP